MNEFKDGDITYCIDFFIKTYKLNAKLNCLDTILIESDELESDGVFHSINEAIDHVIKKLEDMKQ